MQRKSRPLEACIVRSAICERGREQVAHCRGRNVFDEQHETLDLLALFDVWDGLCLGRRQGRDSRKAAQEEKGVV